jgi:uncharacterized delta-60 repeat protein
MNIRTTTSLLFASCALSLQAQLPVNGTIDSTFGTNGLATISHATKNISPVASEFGTDGKFYTASRIESGGNRDILLNRFLSNGTLDNTFGANGSVTWNPSIGAADYIREMKLTSNNKIVVVGHLFPNNRQYLIGRFLSDGTVDVTFNQTGMDIGGGAYDDEYKSCVIEPNGDITVVGLSSNVIGSEKLIRRYKSNGTLDLNFGYNGTSILDESDDESFNQIYRKSSSQYYLVGITDDVNKLYAFDGSGNSIGSFGSSGKFSFNQLAGYKIVISDIVFKNNDIYITGAALNLQTGRTNVIVYKMNSQGVLDNSFGINGFYHADLSSGQDDHGTSMKVLDNGSIFLSGVAQDANGIHRPATFLLASDGTLISNYGSNGVIHYNLPGMQIGVARDMTENAQGQFNLFCYNQKVNSEEGVLLQLKTNVSSIGIEELNQVNDVNVYPNPAHNSLRLDFTCETEGDYRLSLLSTTGQVISQTTVGAYAGQNTFDLSEMIENTNTGIYFLQITSKNQSVKTMKLLLN